MWLKWKKVQPRIHTTRRFKRDLKTLLYFCHERRETSFGTEMGIFYDTLYSLTLHQTLLNDPKWYANIFTL